MANATSGENGSRNETVPFNTLDIAPENLRFGQPADAGIPQLADTMVIGGESNQIINLITRPGAKGEKPHMVLDGRRRWLALALAVSDGRIPEDFPVNITIETDKSRQLAATILTGTEREATHLVDIIQAIGAMKSKKLTTTKIAEALGYSKIDIDRWQALSILPPNALQAMRDGKMTQRQAKLLTKITDPGTQEAFVTEAVNGTLRDHSLQLAAIGSLVTIDDRRVRLAGEAAYTAAGGRIERDLFGETPDALLDPDILQSVWLERSRPTAMALKDAGLTVMVSAEKVYRAPDGWVNPPFDSRGRLSEDQLADFTETERRVVELRNGFHDLPSVDDASLALVTDLAMAQLAMAQALHIGHTVGCAVISPDHDYGVDVAFHLAPAVAQASEDPSTGERAAEGQGVASAQGAQTSSYGRAAPDIVVPDSNISVVAKTNGLHQRYTDIATRGLMRSLADDPAAAQILCIARIFAMVALESSSDVNASSSTLRADRYRAPGEEPVASLDGDVYDRLAAHRSAYLSSGLRPIGWVASLSNGERVTLLAELMAMTLNLRETGVGHIRHAARAEAVELAELTDHDITTYWTPDFAFFNGHSKPELIAILGKMGADDVQAATLKKDDLAAYVTEQAAERGWAPDALSWRQNPADITEGDDAPESEAPDAGVDPAEDSDSEDLQDAARAAA